MFLGMHIRYKDDGTVEIRMKDYVKEAIAEFEEDITRTAISPPMRDLFKVNEESKALSKSRSETFHSVAAELLFVSQRERMDIQLTIAFLCT